MLRFRYGGGGNFQGGISSSYAPSPYANQNPGGGGGGGRRMEGIGSPQNYGQHAQPPNNANGNFRGAMQEAGGVLVSMMKDPLARNSGGATQGVPSQGHSGNLPGYGQGPTVRNSISICCYCHVIYISSS